MGGRAFRAYSTQQHTACVSRCRASTADSTDEFPADNEPEHHSLL